MRINKLHLSIVLILVMLLYNFKPLNTDIISNDANNILSLGIINTKYDFLNIFITNTIVSLLLSIAGFFTGGILTLLIIIWNVLLLYLLYSYAFLSTNDINAILYLSKHAPLEIYALTLFSIIGFRGFKFYIKLIKLHQFDKKLIPNIKELVLPIILLLLASFIEVS